MDTVFNFEGLISVQKRARAYAYVCIEYGLLLTSTFTTDVNYAKQT